MNTVEVVTDPNLMMGKPTIAGTRITVEFLLDHLGAGESPEQIYRSFPHLPTGSIEAALRYAAAALRNEVVIPAKRISA